jgi:hypothetical protein
MSAEHAAIEQGHTTTKTRRGKTPRQHVALVSSVATTAETTCTDGAIETGASPLSAAPLVMPASATPKHVAIVAMGRSMAAFTQLACAKGGIDATADEVWAINATASVIRHHRAFVMDDMRITIPKEAAEGKLVAQGILKWLPAHPGPVYTSTAYPEYPGLVELPLRDTLQAVGGLPYLNTTVAYAFAYAVLIGVKEISLYGCDFTYPDVNISEAGRGCLEYLIGFACANGMKVNVPETTTLLDANLPDDQRLYGYPLGIRTEIVDGQVRIERGPFTTATDGSAT